VNQLIEELKAYQDNIDATEIAEILWLSKLMSANVETENEETFEPKIDNLENELEEIDNNTQIEYEQNLPVEVVYEIVISSPKKEDTKHSFEEEKEETTTHSATIDKKEKPPNIINQFRSLKIKQNRTDKELLDEQKCTEYIESSGIFNPIFKKSKVKESYYTLLIVVDQNYSMFLWNKQIIHFIKSLKSSTTFKQIHIMKLDSSQNHPLFSKEKSDQKIEYDAPLFKDKETLTLLFTDVVGKSWRSKYMFEVLSIWSNYSFVSIVSMLPKRMWQKTPLRLGISLFMRSKKFLPKNSDLRAEFDFIEQSLIKSSTNIPVIPYSDHAFEYLSNILTAKKGSWIDSRIFEELTPKEITDNVEQEIDASTRVERFFSSTPPEARKLAIYCSVLPLNQEVIKEVIKVKSLGNDMDAFAEFFFGGLLDRDRKSSNFEFEFHKGVRAKLIELISMDEVESIFRILNKVIAHSFGVNQTMLDLLYGASENKVLSDKEKEFASLLVKILEEKGSFYERDVERINSWIDTVDNQSINKSLNLTMIRVPHGDFMMGGTSHEIIDYDFEIGKYPVTVGEFRIFIEDTGYKTEAERDDGAYIWDGKNYNKKKDAYWDNPYFEQQENHPIVCVSWNDANAYITWLNNKTEAKYRLPTEKEWEFVCRAGTITNWNFGDNVKDLEKYAWYHDNSDMRTYPVGQKLPNSWEVYDMHGHIWEWCLDDFPNNDRNLKQKIIRGGSWYSIAKRLSSSYRHKIIPSKRGDDVGFRLCKAFNQNDFGKIIELKTKDIKNLSPITEEKVSKKDLAIDYDKSSLKYRLEQRYDEALIDAKKSLKIREEIFDKNSIYISISYNNIAILYTLLKDYNQAHKAYTKSLEIKQSIFAEQHISVAINYNNLAILSFNKKEYFESIEFYNKAISIFEKLPEGGKYLELIKSNYAYVKGIMK